MKAWSSRCVALCLDFLAVAYEDEYLAVYKASTEEEVFRQKVLPLCTPKSMRSWRPLSKYHGRIDIVICKK